MDRAFPGMTTFLEHLKGSFSTSLLIRVWAEGYGDATAVFLNLKHPVYAYSKPKLLTEDELYDSYESDDADTAEALVKEKTIARAKDKMREVIGVLKEQGSSF